MTTAPLGVPIQPVERTEEHDLDAAKARRKRTSRFLRLPLIEEYLGAQRDMTAVGRFARHHEIDAGTAKGPSEHLYRDLIPLQRPKPGQQFAFEVDLDLCTGCKACVTACHSMNGLDDAEAETWRWVGSLQGGTSEAPEQKTVTAACHHCVDPACLKGCPVKAYEKDPVTGIVRHLDDQCIGCQYCTLTCPYEVPQFNQRLGIVRKCDMCSDRLEAGAAPACVQGCPNGAIAIRIVETSAAREAAAAEEFLPGAPSPRLTVPTTHYVSTRPLAPNMLPADVVELRPASPHSPLAIALVLTQWSVGALAFNLVLGGSRGPGPLMAQSLLGALIGIVALGVSACHLGRPRYAFRAVLGVATSWLSREVLAFGLFAPLAIANAALACRPLIAKSRLLGPAVASVIEAIPSRPIGGFTVAIGFAGVFCSVMIYDVTGKRLWSFGRSAFRFLCTTLLLGLSMSLFTGLGWGLAMAVSATFRAQAPWLCLALAAGTSLKLGWELRIMSHLGAANSTELRRTAMLLRGELHPVFKRRQAWGLAGALSPLATLLALGTGAPAALAAAFATTGLVALVFGEMLERALFFRSVSGPRMPGQLVR